jgi:hypothetical protein
MAIAQKTPSTIPETIKAYMKANETKDYEKALGFYYEKYFQIIPKATLLQKLLELENNEMLKAHNTLSKIVSVSDSINVDDVDYAFAIYEARVTITFKDHLEDEFVLFMKQQIEAKEQKVSYDKEKKEITYHRNSTCIMVKNNGWKILPYSQKLLPAIKTMVPKEVFEKLNIAQ